MAISRSLMNRQLRADGGIMQVAPREKFGLGSKLKKFVRKIIPNEVADIAVKAAPFVAPFNPAVAAAMSGLGTFDQTGSIGDSLKGGALTYGLGQGARYLGGAGFQDPSLSAFTPSGFKSGFSSPFGSDTGIGKMLSESAANKGQVLNQELKGIKGIDTSVPLKKPTVIDGSIDMVTGGADGFGIIQDTGINKSTVAKEPGFLKNLFDGVSNQDYGKVAQTIGDGAKKFGKAMFTDKNGNIDKAAVMGAITFAASYAEARALAAETGVDEDLTEEEYNEALKDEKKEEYAGYLTNFFGGVKDGGRIGFNDGSDPGDIVLASDSNDDLIKSGKFARVVRVLMDEGFDFAEAVKEAMRQGYNQGGRIGFESGANEMIKTQLLEEIMPNTDTTTEDYIVIMTEDGPKVVLRSQAPSESMMMDTTTSVFGDAGRGRRIPEELRADGGRIGFKKGSDPVYEMYLEDLEAGIIPSDKSYNEYLDDIEDDPDYDYSYAKGGRVSRKFGSPKEGESEVGIMTIDVEAGDDEDEENMMMAGGITFSSAEKSFLFKKLGGAGGADRSFTMPQLYGILKNPNSPSNIDDAKVLKEIAIMGLGKGQKDGGRIGLKGGGTDKMEQYKKYVSDMIKDGETPVDFEEFLKMTNYKDGGRIGYKGGANRVSELLILRDELIGKGEDVSDIEAEIFQLTGKTFRSVGGISDIPTGKMRKNNAGVVERDYRDEGGFVPVGIKERADDVPAMLSKNEFVMTADAVRGIGNGSVEEGSKKLYNTMKQAEKVGKA